MRKAIQKGFTLIELMIVVAIVGILAAVAMPAYQDFVIRASVTEGLSMMNGIKKNIEEFHSAHGCFPAADITTGILPTGPKCPGGANSISASGLALVVPSTEVVQQVQTVANATNGLLEIQTTFGNNANAQIAGTILGMSSWVDASGGIGWVCGSETLPTPVGTPVVAPAATGTNVGLAFLPTSCK